MHAILKTTLTALALWGVASQSASAFCGFYVSSGDAKLFNEASKVVMVRDGNRTVLTMANDFHGDVTDFAMVVPAPTVLEREQINVAENAVIDHLDAYTAPRLVEYHDPDPCRQLSRELSLSVATSTQAVPEAARTNQALGVTVEAEYTVGEYDIVILSATESDGLATWLTTNGYRIPEGAAPVLGSYIAQDMKFFVARVNLDEHAKSGGGFLRPLQIAFESPKFMLPIRLGTVNAKGMQDLILYTLTRQGRVETANYRTIRMPTGNEIPTYVRDDFGPVYKAIYAHSIERAGGAGIMLEYAWDMSWCDPCAADPLSREELAALGVYWLGEDDRRVEQGATPNIQPQPQPIDVFVTRLHARYDAESFPEDLRLIETGDRQNFQGRYVLRHPWTGAVDCKAGEDYTASLPERFDREAKMLASLTGWSLEDIRATMEQPTRSVTPAEGGTSWWQRLWKN